MTRERWGIIAGITGVILAARCGVPALLWAFGLEVDWRILLGGFTGTLALILPLPVVIGVLQRSRHWLIEAACGLVYFAVASVVALLVTVLLNWNEPADIELLMTLLPLNVPTAIVIFFTALGVVRALQWYRASLAVDAQRRELESEEAQRTRRVVEERYQPATIVATLTEIQRMLPHDVEAADTLLHQLARHARMLLRAPSVAPSPPAASPAEGGGATQVRAQQPVFVTLLVMVLAYGVTATATDLQSAEWETYLPLARLVSVCAFVVAGLGLGWFVSHAARLPLPAALAAGTLAAIATGIAVTAFAHFVVVRMGAGAWADMLSKTLLLTRNIIIATALAAIAFAYALSRVLLAKRIETARFRDEVALAETRELEARFHPHFLFNALTSIAALIRIDPAVAAVMCRRLSDLVEQIVASAGVHRWPLRTELSLAVDYLAVQRMRFGDRILVEAWDVPSAAYNAIVPRLLLQPLLENAVKHGVARHREKTAVGLSVKRRGRRLSFDLWNDAPGATSTFSYGRGLAFVHRSVEAAGGEITIDTTIAGRFAVRCSIPQ